MTGKPRKRAVSGTAAGRPRKRPAAQPPVEPPAAQPEQHTCLVQDCELVVFKRGLCAQHHDDLSSRAGPFARTPPPPRPDPPPDSDIKTGDDVWARLSR